MRLTADIRTEKLSYKEIHVPKSKEKVVSAKRENEQRVFLSDPYYVVSFKESFIDDIKTITSRHTRDVHGVDRSGKNQKWKHISSQHWSVIRVEINYKDKNIHILWEDPYGKDQIPKALIEHILSILKEWLCRSDKKVTLLQPPLLRTDHASFPVISSSTFNVFG